MIALIAAAAAFEMAGSETWAVPADARAVMVGPDGRVGVVGATDTWELDPVDGTVLARAPVGGHDAVLRVPGGVVSVWGCGDDGVWALPWPGAGFGDFVVVSPLACRALVATDTGLVIADTTAWTADDDGAGGLGAGEPVAMTFSGPPILAWNGAEVAGAARGVEGYQVLGPRGVSTYATSGAVAGLGAYDAGWAWTRGDPPSLVTADARVIPLDPGPGAFLTADVDADGLDDLVVAHTTSHTSALVVTLASTGIPLSLTAPFEVRALAAADLDADGCAEVLALGAGGLVRYGAVGCGDDRDADGDGQTPAEGDCDDADDWTYAGAEEVCDGVDNDCDVSVDELGTLRTAGARSYEGGTAVITVSVDGCAADVALAWEAPASALVACTGSASPTLTCDLLDDGEVELVAIARDGAGDTVARATYAQVAENSDPSIGHARIDETVEIGTVEDILVLTHDVAADTISLHLDPVPAGASLVPWPAGVERTTETAVRFVAAAPGVFTGVLHATDEDGGHSSIDVTFTVEPREDEAVQPSEPRCGCYGPGGGGYWGAVGLLALLRRRRTA